MASTLAGDYPIDGATPVYRNVLNKAADSLTAAALPMDNVAVFGGGKYVPYVRLLLVYYPR